MGTTVLYEGERIDHLMTRDLRIIQSRDVFSFSMDAVLLARFASVPKRGRIVDLCSGNGVIPLLLTTRTEASIAAVEIQPRLADMAERSVRLNGLEERIEVVCADLRDVHEKYGYGSFDLVTVNPPYLPPGTGDRKLNPHIAAARHELNGGLDDIVTACARLLKTGGKVAMVHRPQRLADILVSLRANRLEPKRMRFVHPRIGAEANMVLVEAAKDGKPELRMLPPLIVYEQGETYTQELLDIYEGGSTELAFSEAEPESGERA